MNPLFTAVLAQVPLCLGPLQALYESAFGTVAVDESAVTVAVTSTHPDLFTNAVPNHLVQQ